MSESRLVIWAFDSLMSLENLSKLLKGNFNRKIDFLEGEALPEEDKTLYNRWIGIGSKDIRIENIKIEGNSFRFINTRGIFETNYGKERAYVDKQLLTRKARVFNHSVNAIFFEFENIVYVVIETPKRLESKIRTLLLGQRKGNISKEWGGINYKTPLPFEFKSDFFYWLFTTKGKKITHNKTKIALNLIDVSAVRHISDRTVYDSNSSGPDLLDGSYSALSGLGLNEEIQQGGCKFKLGSTIIVANFNQYGVTMLDADNTVLNEGSHLAYYENNFPYFVICIYGVIFPIILEEFSRVKASGEWNPNEERKHRKIWAKKVIRQLCEFNNISDVELLEIHDYVVN